MSEFFKIKIAKLTDLIRRSLSDDSCLAAAEFAVIPATTLNIPLRTDMNFKRLHTVVSWIIVHCITNPHRAVCPDIGNNFGLVIVAAHT